MVHEAKEGERLTVVPNKAQDQGYHSHEHDRRFEREFAIRDVGQGLTSENDGGT